jgi:predicted nucleotidyltransferase
MDQDTAIARLQAHEAALKQRGVRTLYLFGSTIRVPRKRESSSPTHNSASRQAVSPNS